MRIGCVIASRIPAMAFASVWRAAKPTTRPSTADEARMPFATLESSSKFDAAIATPMSRMHRRDQPPAPRRRVWVAGDSSPRVDELADSRAALRDQPVDDHARSPIATAMATPALIQSARGKLAAAV